MPTEKNIKTPEELYDHFCAYKILCKASPKKENFWSSKSEKEVSVSREVPLTWNSFELYLRKEKVLCKLDDYKANKDGRYTEYADIIRVIDIEIYEDKFSGAVAGIFQHNIISRDLGLVEKKENDNRHTFEDKDAIASWLDKFGSKVKPNDVENL